MQQFALKKISVQGGPTTTLTDAKQDLLGASWGPNDDIVFGTADLETGLMRISSAGGEPESHPSGPVFPIGARRAAGVTTYEPIFKDILLFVGRCQNFPDDSSDADPQFDDGDSSSARPIRLATRLALRVLMCMARPDSTPTAA